MKKAPSMILSLFTVLVFMCTVAFFIWRNGNSSSLHIRSMEANRTTSATGQDFPDQETGVVNINTADLATLMTLPGIGQTLASRIIDYRNIHGQFDSVAGLLNVEGIGAGKLESILDLITTGGTT